MALQLMDHRIHHLQIAIEPYISSAIADNYGDPDPQGASHLLPNSCRQHSTLIDLYQNIGGEDFILDDKGDNNDNASDDDDEEAETETP